MMWLIALTLLGPPLMLGLVLVMGYVEQYVESVSGVTDRITDQAGNPLVAPRERTSRVIHLNQVVRTPTPRAPVGPQFDEAGGRPVAQ